MWPAGATVNRDLQKHMRQGCSRQICPYTLALRWLGSRAYKSKTAKRPLGWERAMTKVRPMGASAMVEIFAMASLVITSVGKQQPSDRAKQIGVKIKWMCGPCDMAAAICSHPGGEFSGPCGTAKMMLG